MFKFLGNLFAAKTTRTPNLKARLNVDVMEDRYAPAYLYLDPGTIRGFNPQPEPPLTSTTLVSTTDTGLTRGIIIVGG